jgi:hypothetical protein
MNIPTTKNFLLFNNTNYKVVELKNICKHYNLIKSGNKNVIKERIYNYLNKQYNILKIQKVWKLYLLKKLISLKGPGLIKRKLCINDIDFFSLDNLDEIDFYQFISYKDNNNNIYGFDIVSLFNLFINSKDKTLNPFNRDILPIYLLNNISKIKLYSKFLFNIKIVINIEKIKWISKSQEIEMNSIQLFQRINSNGFYSEYKWFLDLNLHNIRLFIRYLYDIWIYRAELSFQTKKNICHPHGLPFYNIHLIDRFNLIQIQYLAIDIINNITNKGVDNVYKTLGCNLVLSALTLVSNDAAIALPWLYQSVALN